MGEVELYDNYNSLPSYQDTDWDRAIAEWEKATKAELIVQLYKGAIICQVDTVYGQQSRQAFAYATGDNYSTIRDYASVYSRLERLEPDDQSTVLGMLHESHLTYSHVLRATPIEDNAEFMQILTQAHDEEKSVKWIAEMRAVGPEKEEEVQRTIDNAPGRDEALEGEIVDTYYPPKTLRFQWTGRSSRSLVDAFSGEVIIDEQGNLLSESAIEELVDLANGVR